ncbi:MAG: peptidase MA family metallohydrolase [Syntrophales bacterium]|nr:peptidase MA family metallohydrolase [Syntrophales bacterium]
MIFAMERGTSAAPREKRICGLLVRGRPIIVSVIALFLLFVFLPAHLSGYELNILYSSELTVYYDESLEGPARKVASLFPELRGELEETIGWPVVEAPTVVLMNDRRAFHDMVGSDYVAAVAIPRKNLIIIDNTRMTSRPFTLRNTLKHELCHLLIHQHVDSSRLPRWLDEGIAQWTSDGLSEVVIKRNRFLVPRAVITGNAIPLKFLESSFPGSEQGMLLAYEKSKSIVEYILREYGREGLLGILEGLRRGYDIEIAVEKSLTISFDELEKKWHGSFKGMGSWYAFAGYHMYELLFVFAALLSVASFIRYLKRKRDFSGYDEDENGDTDDEGLSEGGRHSLN